MSKEVMKDQEISVERAMGLFRYGVWFGQNIEGSAKRLVKYSLWGSL